MSTTEVGRAAETAAARYLEQRGFTILVRNWRTRFHEVDIVAKHGTRTHLIEVKYRRSEQFGSGLDYISPDKLRRLGRAAQQWILTHGDCVIQIDAITITGTGPYQLHYEPNVSSW